MGLVMGYQLDPAMLDFLRQRTGVGDALPSVDPTPAPTPRIAPPTMPPPDPEVMRLLGEQDAEAARSNTRQDLKEGIGRSMSYFLGQPVNPDRGPPKVDDAVRKFLISRKMGAAQDPSALAKLEETLTDIQDKRRKGEPAPAAWGATPGMTRGEAMAAGFGHAPKALDFGDQPITQSDLDYAKSLGIDARPLKTRKEMLAQINSRLSAGFQVNAQVDAEGRKKVAEDKKTAEGAVRAVDETLAEAEYLKSEVDKNPGAFSATANLAEYVGGDGPVAKVVGRVQSSNRAPKDISTRSVVLKKAYEIKNKLAGAAVSVQEKASIDAFNPSDNDTAPEIKAKIDALIGAIKAARAAKAAGYPDLAPPPRPSAVPAAPAGPARPGDRYLP
jgi:hypothetical protein